MFHFLVLCADAAFIVHNARAWWLDMPRKVLLLPWVEPEQTQADNKPQDWRKKLAGDSRLSVFLHLTWSNSFFFVTLVLPG